MVASHKAMTTKPGQPAMKPFYITTAIDYTNGKPHIGHAYEKVLADAIARYQRFRGREVYFLTGVDQHGQKVQQSAQAEGIHPATFSQRITKHFVKLWETLGVDYDGWAATTDERHTQCVQKILQNLHDQGQLYKKSHSGFYSVRQEHFLSERDREKDGSFGPQWGEVVEFEEENWYFRLSDHVEWLKDFLTRTPDFVIPDFRQQELINAMERAEIPDLCISRPKERLRWGIELPFDTDFVTYVWFDALTNYISFAGYLAEPDSGLPGFDSLWPADLHIIGKDILVPPHGIYWPIMLHAAGFPDEAMPKLLVHGWWNIRSTEGKSEKMSKSLGNVVDPFELAETFTADGLRYFLLRDISTGHDADFSADRILTRYNTDLANDLGNLANRCLNMNKRYRGGTLNHSSHDDPLHMEMRELAGETHREYQRHFDNHQPSAALEAVWKLIAFSNRFVDQCAPWELAKSDQNDDKLDAVLYHLCEALAHISLLVAPALPNAAAKLQDQLKLSPAQRATPHDDIKWGLLDAGHQTGKPKPLFPRIQAEETDSE